MFLSNSKFFYQNRNCVNFSMGRWQKTKRVTWAPDVNLFQARLFSTTKPFSETEKGSVRESGAYQPGEDLPPGFREIQPENLWRVKMSRIPLRKWRCPDRFEVNSEWQVASGGESKEIETQNQRQMRVLEAIYPRTSAIPPSLLVPLETRADDQDTPLIPLTPIEEAEAETTFPQPHHISSGAPSSQCSANDILAAALMSSKGDQINIIGHDLLLRILCNPQILQQQRITSNGETPTTTAAEPSHPPKLRPGFDVSSAPSRTTGIPVR